MGKIKLNTDKVEKLLAADISLDDISRRLNVSRRTIERYIAKKRSGKDISNDVLRHIKGNLTDIPAAAISPVKRREIIQVAQNAVTDAVKHALAADMIAITKSYCDVLRDPAKIAATSARDASIILGVLTDKSLLLTGQATSITDERALVFVCADLVRQRRTLPPRRANDDAARQDDDVIDVKPDR